MNILEQTHYAVVVTQNKTIKIVGKSEEDVKLQLVTLFGKGSALSETEVEVLRSPIDGMFSIIDTKLKQLERFVEEIKGNNLNRYTEKDVIKRGILELYWLKSLYTKDKSSDFEVELQNKAKEVSEATSRNSVAESYMIICDFLGFSDLFKEFKEIEKLHIQAGSLTTELRGRRDKAYKDMSLRAKQFLGQETYHKYFHTNL